MTRIGLPDSVRLILRPVEHCRMNIKRMSIKRMSIKRVNIDRETHREHWTRVGANRARDLPNGASIKRWRRESLKKLDRWESQVLKNLKIAECCELMQRESDGWETVCSDCEEWNLRTGDPMESERCSGGDGKRGGNKNGSGNRVDLRMFSLVRIGVRNFAGCCKFDLPQIRVPRLPGAQLVANRRAENLADEAIAGTEFSEADE